MGADDIKKRDRGGAMVPSGRRGSASGGNPLPDFDRFAERMVGHRDQYQEMEQEINKRLGERREGTGFFQQILSGIPFINKLVKEQVNAGFSDRDALEELEIAQREELNDVQEVFVDLAEVVEEHEKRVAQFREEFERARDEEWSIEDLEELFTSRAAEHGVIVTENTQKLMRQAREDQSPEELEVARENLMIQLEDDVAIGEVLIQHLHALARGGVQIFLSSAAQYSRYVNMRVPIAAARDAAHAMADTQQTGVLGEVALRETAAYVGEAFEVAIQGVALLSDPEMRAKTRAEIQAATDSVYSNLQELSRQIAASGTKQKALQEGRVIDGDVQDLDDEGKDDREEVRKDSVHDSGKEETRGRRPRARRTPGRRSEK